jgi:nickel-dependent lactate racemase
LNSTVQFETGGKTRFLECQSQAASLTDLPAAVRQSLAHPLDFPSLEQALVPGDKVVLALDAQVPQGPAVVQAVANSLEQWGVSQKDVTVLVATVEDQAACRQANQQSEVLLHNPAKRDQMAYLAATPAGEPLYLNRVLCDADVVIPIAAVEMQAGGAKASDGLYPVFSAAKAQPVSRQKGRNRAANGKHRHESADRPDVSWLLGVQCMVQVVPGPGQSASAVLAGEPAATRRESRRRCSAAWQFDVPGPASLVVAAVEGDASQQTWEQVGRALAAATRAVAEDGAIVVCCELNEEPGPALKALAESDDRHAALKAIRRAQLPDAKVAARLVRACNRARVYLLSQLADDIVEELGMAPVQEPAEVARLASRYENCLLLANAQHALAIPEE